MRILLVQPECQKAHVGFRLAAMPEPLSLEFLATTVPTHEVRILDMRIDDDLESALKSFSPEIVGVTSLTTEVYAAQEVVRVAKRFSPEIFTLVGGHHASLLPDDFYRPEVDLIVRGEGERTFPRVVDAVAGDRDLQAVASTIWRNPEGEFIESVESETTLNMDELGLPRRDLTAQYRSEYFFLFDQPDTSIATGRGCPYRCNFCSVWVFGRGMTRQMSPERVLAEVAAVDTEHITFVDDNFLMNHKREHAIADLLNSAGIEKRFSMECRTDSIVRHPDLVAKWVDAGLYAVLLGLEGASDKTLKSVNKRTTAGVNGEAIRILHDLGVIIWGAFLVDPDWDHDDFSRLRDYVAQNEITHTQFTVLTPLPGTELYEQRRADLLTDDYSCYDALHAVTPTRLPREDFYREFADLYRKRDVGPYFDLVRAGKLTIEDCRRGQRIYDAMSRAEFYMENDPVLRSNWGVTD